MPLPRLFAVFCTYLVGAMFYLLFIALILYRWIFLSMEPVKLTPPYWINMGALAITALAGGRLILASKDLELLHDLHPFIVGFTLFFLGNRNLVDSAVSRCRYLETCDRACTDHL